MISKQICSQSDNNCINDSIMKKNILKTYEIKCSNITSSTCSLNDMYYFVMSSYIFPEFKNLSIMENTKKYILNHKGDFQYDKINESNLEDYYKFIYINYALNNSDEKYNDKLISYLSDLKTNNLKEKFFKSRIFDLYLSNHGYTVYNFTSLYNLPLTNKQKNKIIMDVCNYNTPEKGNLSEEKYYLIQEIYCNKFNKKDYKIFIDFISIKTYNLTLLRNQINLYNYITDKYNFK